MNLENYSGYNTPKVLTINEYIKVVTYKSIDTNTKDIVVIYNSKEDNYITLYNTTLKKIYNLLNIPSQKKKKRVSNKRPLSGKVFSGADKSF